MADIRITGVDRLTEVARALKQAGDKGLTKELDAGLDRAAKPLQQAARESARQNLPHRGELNDRAAQARFSTKRRGGRNPGIKFTAKGFPQLRRIDRQGKVKHPVYGHRDRWVMQSIPRAQHWFIEPLEEGAPRIRPELIRALDRIAVKIARKY